MNNLQVEDQIVRESVSGYVSLIDAFMRAATHIGVLPGTEVYLMRQICERQIREYESGNLSENVSANLSARWFEAYERGLAEGLYGEHAAITLGLAMRSDGQAGVTEENSLEAHVTRHAKLLGVTHGYWLRSTLVP
ncbi:hypothetical protein [Burkholderia savannae]|uniref:hypothetical protein n=1 Tax=Burkholderia savannae TaxID=1637837 RepID=UPI0012E33DF3|nr:hypothetical protein [Burkholderia savannae]